MLNALKDLRIGLPIIIGNLIMLMLMGVVAISGITGLERVAQSNGIALNRRGEMADLRMLQLIIKTMYNHQTNYISDGDPVDAQAFRSSITPLQDFRTKIRRTIESEDERLNLNIIDRQTNEYITLFVEKIIPARQINDSASLKTLKDQSNELISQMDPFIQNMIADYEKKANDADQNAQDTKTQTILIVIVLSILVGLIGITTGFLMARTITYSARQIVLASEQLRQSEAALQESERFLNNIIEHIPNMVFVKDAVDLRFIRFNRGGEKLLGLKREEIYGKNDHDFLSKEVADFFRQKDLEVLQLKQLVDIPEESLETRNMGIRTLHTQKIPILDEAGNPKYLLGISEDITERKQAEDKIRQLNAELEQRVDQRTAQLELTNRELESFAYSISHDLRAPLRAMEGFSQILMEEFGPTLGEHGLHYLNRIRFNVVRMANLIDDLLNLSRITRSELTRRQIDLCILANGVLKELKESQPERQVEFILPSQLIIEADPGLIEVVLSNLLRNAWKYTRRCRLAVIEFGCQDENGKGVYFVRDNGVGFDMTYSHKLFKPFQRLHSAEDFEGTGVGLAMVQRIIQRHGGHVWAEGAIDQGATFYFTLD
jgi:PAS domain S-box-containing protein